MQYHRPSLTLFAGVMLLILAVAASFFRHGQLMNTSEEINSKVHPGTRARSTTKDSSGPSGSTRSKRLSRIEKLISEKFPEERDIEFINSPGDLSQYYKKKGLTDFCGEIRNALRGNEDSLAEIFTTYMAEPESYGHFINILIENLGDDFFFQQIQKQPESTQNLILGQVWQVINRSPLSYQSDGSIPVADSGIYYPKCGELFLRLLEEELKSDYWQKEKRKKSEQ